MKFPVIYCSWLRVSGMALFPFILVNKKYNKDYSSDLIIHERIHLRQQLELLIIPFYMLYALNYLVNLLRYKKHHKAYINIIFEKEAYLNDAKAGYLKSRKLWAFLKYC